jgi:hypothetical protein
MDHFVYDFTGLEGSDILLQEIEDGVNEVAVVSSGGHVSIYVGVVLFVHDFLECNICKKIDSVVVKGL